MQCFSNFFGCGTLFVRTSDKHFILWLACSWAQWSSSGVEFINKKWILLCGIVWPLVGKHFSENTFKVCFRDNIDSWDECDFKSHLIQLPVTIILVAATIFCSICCLSGIELLFCIHLLTTGLKWFFYLNISHSSTFQQLHYFFQ